MMKCTIAVTGLSGVGKSTLLKAVARRVDFLHLQASALIRDARDTFQSYPVSHDQLRYVDLDENQHLLVDGFAAHARSATGLVVLDGHTLVERNTDFVLIGAEVFSAIGISGMLFLHDDPSAIVARRAGDHTRERPAKDVDVLAKIQAAALANARDICRSVQVPLKIVAPVDLDNVVEFLQCSLDARIT
ncbi:MAG TPA: AAA family ATPase [Pseudolabrys sp.]